MKPHERIAFFSEKPYDTEITYKGYLVFQSGYNNHVSIYQGDQRLFHAQTDKKLTENELRKMVDDYLSVQI